MNIGSIRPDDLVECNVKGRRFLAWAREVKPARGGGTLRIFPTNNNISYREVTSRQVTAWYKRMGRKKANPDDA